MAYLGLDLDNLCWEIKALMENNYGQFSEEVLEDNFDKAKADILESFREIIDDNREDVIRELKGGLED